MPIIRNSIPINLHFTSININEAAQNHAEIVKAVALVV